MLFVFIFVFRFVVVVDDAFLIIMNYYGIRHESQIVIQYASEVITGCVDQTAQLTNIYFAKREMYVFSWLDDITLTDITRKKCPVPDALLGN